MMDERMDEQVERLRAAARTFRRLGEHVTENKLLDAADTITELRGALSVASVDYRHLSEENAKLREKLADAPKCEACEAMLDCDECLRADGSHKERRRLSFENAKLRELVKYMHRCYVHGHDWGPYGAPEKQHVEDEMRELGIEVDA